MTGRVGVVCACGVSARHSPTIRCEAVQVQAEPLVDQPCSDLVDGTCNEAWTDQDGTARYCCMTVDHDGNHMVRMRDKGDNTWLYSWPNRSELTKDTAPCCAARALPDGRLSIGFCSPNCLRRPA